MKDGALVYFSGQVQQRSVTTSFSFLLFSVRTDHILLMQNEIKPNFVLARLMQNKKKHVGFISFCAKSMWSILNEKKYDCRHTFLYYILLR